MYEYFFDTYFFVRIQNISYLCAGFLPCDTTHYRKENTITLLINTNNNMQSTISKMKSLWILFALCLFPVWAFAQNFTATGTVIDNTGEPVPGASVVAKGTTTGVMTDIDGNFELKVNQGTTLVISYIGYETQEVKAASKMKITLREDNKLLEDVVVIGYGTQRKEAVTGSVASVSASKLMENPSSNITQSLQNRVAGVDMQQTNSQPGAEMRIRIRGQRSLSADNNPLIVLDGIPFNGSLSDINPSDIKTMDILKDASSTAIYGSRGANGVILVTTKKGKMGAPKISYSGTFGFTDEVARPQMLRAYNYGRLFNAVKAADPTNTSLNKTTALFQADELEAMKALNYDLLNKYWETGFTMQHSVNVSGATDKVSYFAGISYFDQDGNLGKLDYDRWNYRAGIDVKLSKYLSANLNVSGDYAKKNTPLVKVGGSNSEKDYNLLLTHPYYIPEDVNGYAIPAYGISNGMKNQNQYYNFNTLQNNGDYKRNMTNNMNVNASVNYDFGWSKILNGLKLKFSYSKSINNDKGNEYGSSFTLYQMINRYGSGSHLYTPTSYESNIDYLAVSNFNPIATANGNYLYRSMTRTDNYQVNFTAQLPIRTDSSAAYSLHRPFYMSFLIFHHIFII